MIASANIMPGKLYALATSRQKLGSEFSTGSMIVNFVFA
jgi:hypothetical protein